MGDFEDVFFYDDSEINMSNEAFVQGGHKVVIIFL